LWASSGKTSSRESNGRPTTITRHKQASATAEIAKSVENSDLNCSGFVTFDEITCRLSKGDPKNRPLDVAAIGRLSLAQRRQPNFTIARYRPDLMGFLDNVRRSIHTPPRGAHGLFAQSASQTASDLQKPAQTKSF
jgi:hypothetical protein